MNGYENLHRLGDICEFNRGLTYKKADERVTSSNAVLRANNITLKSGELNFDEIKYIDGDISIPATKKLTADSILICTASGSKRHLGKTAFVESDLDFAFGGFMGLLTPNHGLSAKYLYWLTRSKAYTDFIASLTDGVNINNLRFNQLAEFRVPVPPLSEQQRIVAILDEAFDGIASAVAATEQNLVNARELFDSHLSNAITALDQLVPGRKLGSIVDRLTNGYVGPTRDIYVESGVPYLLARHVKRNRLNFDGRTFVSQEFNQKHKKSLLKAGDVLLVQSGHIGQSAVVPDSHEGHNCHAMIVISPMDEHLRGDFLSMYFASRTMQSRFREIRTGSTVPHLNCRDVRELQIPTPKLVEQQRLVDTIGAIESEVAHFESIYQHKLSSLTELKQSILQKAFAGELTAEPDKALAAAGL